MTFPFTLERPIEHKAGLPDRADVVVIGGGIAGVMTAWFLVRQGQRVVLCEKGRIAAEQSSRNWGWIRQQGRDPAELPIMIEANRIWQGLEAEAGADLGFRQEGVLYLARDAADLARYEAWLPHAREHGLDTRLLTRAELGERVRGGKWQGALWTASDARAEPWVAVPALARALAREGAQIVEGCAVRALDVVAGRVAGVVTEQGRIGCDAVVLAGGAWSGLFARNQGIALPQLSVLSSVAATGPMPEVFAGNAADRRFAFRRRADGGYTLAPGSTHDFFIGPDALRHGLSYLPQLRQDPLGTRFRLAAPAGYPDAWRTPRRWGSGESPFERCRILNPQPNMRALRGVQAAFAEAFPALGAPDLRTVWAGMIDTMPDAVPVIDHVAALPGLVIATGLSGHGFGIGPGIGRVVADLVLGNPVGHDLARFRLGRFSDGSAIRPGPSL
ncbi:NAD(P)/FAD-dependent oxidoreductase [Plastorhodobacter daqingensis]|uniref:NAD(P)/FAD-dependent oxidoreductase n=1 Tax=Plastorhodobacter daqingensis TaxID=1387281 RepID=A0ABW2UJ96_9RHOB